MFGWFSALVMPAVRIGIGAELEGEIRLVQGELSVEGRVGIAPVLGWECGGATPACRGLNAAPVTNNLKTTSRMPSDNDVQAKVSAHFYVLAGLDATFFLGAVNAQIVEARIGPKQSFDLAFEPSQAALGGYASEYDLKFEGVIEPGAALKKAIEKVIGSDSTTVSLSATFASPISESPKGTLSVDKARVRPDAPVEFTVELATSSMEYRLLGYNVTGWQLYRKRSDEIDFTPWKAMTQTASNRATYRWVPTEADAGTYEFAAFVNTQLVTPLLEVAPDSRRTVEVSCFSGGSAVAAPPTTRGRSVTLAAAAGASCADTWAGDVTYIAKTPGLPTANIATKATITWRRRSVAQRHPVDPLQGDRPVRAGVQPPGRVRLEAGAEFVRDRRRSDDAVAADAVPQPALPAELRLRRRAAGRHDGHRLLPRQERRRHGAARLPGQLRLRHRTLHGQPGNPRRQHRGRGDDGDLELQPAVIGLRQRRRGLRTGRGRAPGRGSWRRRSGA